MFFDNEAELVRDLVLVCSDALEFLTTFYWCKQGIYIMAVKSSIPKRDNRQKTKYDGRQLTIFLCNLPVNKIANFIGLQDYLLSG